MAWMSILVEKRIGRASFLTIAVLTCAASVPLSGSPFDPHLSPQAAAPPVPEAGAPVPSAPPATEEAEAGSLEDEAVDSGVGEEEAAPLIETSPSQTEIDETESEVGTEISVEAPSDQTSDEESEIDQAAPIDFDAEAPLVEPEETDVTDQADENNPDFDSGLIVIDDVEVEDRTEPVTEPWAVDIIEEQAEQEGQSQTGAGTSGTAPTGSTTGATTGTMTGTIDETETGAGFDIDIDTGSNASGAMDVDVSATIDADTDASGLDETGPLDSTSSQDDLPATGEPEPSWSAPPLPDAAARHEFPPLQEPRAQEPPFEVQRQQAIREAIRALGDGFIAWTPALKMRQGQGEIVRVRISEENLPELIWEMPEGIETQVDPVSTSSSMIVRLKGSEEAFRIRSLSGEQQAIAPPFTEWTWEVTPLTSGRHRLDLEVVAKFWIAEDDSEQLARVKHADIDVVVDPWYSTRIFASRNWQWLLSSPAILILLGWIARKVFVKPERRAGF